MLFSLSNQYWFKHAIIICTTLYISTRKLKHNRCCFRKREFFLLSAVHFKCYISYKTLIVLPKINLWVAHTSNVAFAYSLITQWYSILLVIQLCFRAFSRHFFLLAALSHSILVVGQNGTNSALSTAVKWQ